MKEKITRTWRVDAEAARQFEDWCNKTHTSLGDAMSMAMWVVMRMTPDQRQLIFESMDTDRDVVFAIMDATQAVPTAEELMSAAQSVVRSAQKRKGKKTG